MTRPPLQRPKVRSAGEKVHNVTVGLYGSDIGRLRAVMARYQVRSYSAAVRCALRELCGVAIEVEEKRR